MGASTRWFVTVCVPVMEVMEVSAVTSAEAEEFCMDTPGVLFVKEVKHWSECEEE